MARDSLTIANTIELLGGGVASTNPACPGAMFRLQPGGDPGAPQPTTDFVASLLLDGERPFGRRSSNRTVRLPIWITAPDRRTLAAAQELLQTAIDQDYFTMTWTRDPDDNPGGVPLPMILDCFRAEPTVPLFDLIKDRQLSKQVQITVPALPYGRSDQQELVSFDAPVPTSPPTAVNLSPVLLDDFSAISSPLVSRSNRCVVGPFTACWDPDRFGDPGGQVTKFDYGSTFSAPVNLEGMSSLQMWFGLGSRYYANLEFHGKTHGTSFAFTLTDSAGRTLSFARNNVFLSSSQSAQDPVFSQITVGIPQNSATFNYAAVTGYALEVTNRVDRVRRLHWVTAYLDNLRAMPGTQVVSPAVRGAVYTIYAPRGTARSAVTMSFQQAPSPGTVSTITAAGPGIYTVPALTSYLKVQNTGGGGAGAGMTGAGVGAGGGGAEEAEEAVFPAGDSQQIPYVVGAGAAAGASPAAGQPTVFGPGPSGDLQVTANGGQSVATNSNVAGAGGTGSANGTSNAGGAGRANPAGTFGGGGGSAGGPASAGNTPQGSASQVFTSSGTFTCPPGVTSVLGIVTGGGGGSGSGGATGNGQGGGGGEVRVGTVPVTPGNAYTVTIGGSVSGVTGGGDGNNGNQSSFAGDAGVTLVAKGGGKGLGNSQLTSRPSNGGTGGSGGTGYPGGRGGAAYPFSGGGGSSAANGTPGNDGGTPFGAIAPAGGGNGGNSSGAASGNGTAGGAPGGGGGGTFNSANTSGGGARGQVTLVFPVGTGAPTSTGGAAVAGGGAGGNGGATAGSAGSAGGAPGGGGGGAFSSGSTLAGGKGGDGQLKVTPFTPAAFKNLIVHRPPAGALKTFQPMISVGNGADVPNGTTQYTMPQPVTGVNADFSGTYSVYLIAKSFSGSGSRTVTVTVTQYEYAGGPGYPLATLPVTFTPSQISNGMVVAGVLTLPVKAVAPDNVGGYYTVAVSDTTTADRYYDVLFFDTQGQTVVINQPSSGYVTYYIDAPDPNVNIGRIMGSQNGRPSAIGVMDNAPFISGGPLHVEPNDGDNLLFCYSSDASAPNVSLAFFPCWNFDRTE